jgi:hypothetical protein
MAWSTSFFEPGSTEEKDYEILLEAKKRFKICEDWESQARTWFEYDYKFANADANNMYQWDNWVVGDRQTGKRPCLTINKTMQHNLQIINDGKQNKPGVNIRPVGDEASFEAAQVFQEVVRHIEYVSSAENVYDNASSFQVNAGWGYWRVSVEKITGTFDKEIFIRRIKDPRSVYLDPNINEVDGSDAWFGFIFDDMPKDLYEAKYPKFKDVGNAAFNDGTYSGWINRDTIRVCEYYRKTQEDDKLVYFILPTTGEEVGPIKWSELEKDGRDIFNEIKKREGNLPEEEQTFKEQEELSEKIEVYLIAGNKIIKRTPWLGKYIPIVRLVGTETVIDGVWDCKGHTRALLDPQRIYNVNSSANVEFGALQTKSPLTAAAAAIEGYEDIYARANIDNASVLIFNHVDEAGNAVPAPARMAAPQSSPAYVQQMQIAQNEMMMVSGQYQAQMGENENAKSGVAINARQRQGDRATYHFIDNQAIAIRFTGKILIDLIPKIYDTKRVMRIEAKDNTIMNVTIDPNATKPLEKVDTPGVPQDDNNQQIIDVIFNPNVGNYAVISDTGPSYATRRQEAFNALTQIAAQNKEFMGIAGDILWKVADFPEAQVLAQRWRKIIPKNITGDAVDPNIEQAMHQASDKIEQQLALITQQQKQIDDRNRELEIKEREVALKEKQAGHTATVEAVEQIRADYDALTKRVTAIGNSGPAFSAEQIGPLIKQAIREALQAGGPGADTTEELKGLHEGGTPVGLPVAGSEAPEGDANGNGIPDSLEGVAGSRMAADGKHYVPHRDGGFMEVSPLEAAE